VDSVRGVGALSRYRTGRHCGTPHPHRQCRGCRVGRQAV